MGFIELLFKLFSKGEKEEIIYSSNKESLMIDFTSIPLHGNGLTTKDWKLIRNKVAAK